MGDYTYVYVTPGRHAMVQRWTTPNILSPTLGARTLTVHVDVKAGETHYDRFVVYSYGTNDLGTKWFLEEETAPKGADDIHTKHLSPVDPNVAGGF